MNRIEAMAMPAKDEHEAEGFPKIWVSRRGRITPIEFQDDSNGEIRSVFEKQCIGLALSGPQKYDDDEWISIAFASYKEATVCYKLLISMRNVKCNVYKYCKLIYTKAKK